MYVRTREDGMRTRWFTATDTAAMLLSTKVPAEGVFWLLFVLCSGYVLMLVFLDHQPAMESCKCRRDRGFVENASLKRESLEW